MITFHCPSCGMKLQVPAQMAGVTGPCPQCSANITAPAANPQTPSDAPAAAAPQPPQQAPQQQLQQQSVQQPTPLPDAPQRQQPANPQVQQEQPPRQIADTPRQEIPPAAQTPRPPKKRDSLPRDIEAPKTPRNWMRVIFPLAFLAVATITVLVVLQAAGIYEIYDLSKLKSGGTDVTSVPGDEDTPPEGPKGNPIKDPEQNTPAPSVGSHNSPTDPSGVTPPIPIGQDPGDASIEGEFPVIELPPPAPKADPADDSTEPETVDPTEPPDNGTKPPADPSKEPAVLSTEDKSPPAAAGSPAYQILTQFLKAKNLEQRLPLISKSNLSDEQLEKSCLTGPLAPVKSRRLAEMVPRDSDGMIQYLYYVSFEDKTAPRLRHHIVVQLVERPGVHPPRVHAAAFIEHYEKKFKTFGISPTKEVTTFHCIAEVRTSVMAKNIPEEVKKNSVRLVIKTHPDSEAMFDAFLNKNSPLMDKIGPGKEFPYVEPRFGILSFRWNTSHPGKPYIELNDIVASGWEK